MPEFMISPLPKGYRPGSAQLQYEGHHHCPLNQKTPQVHALHPFPTFPHPSSYLSVNRRHVSVYHSRSAYPTVRNRPSSTTYACKLHHLFSITNRRRSRRHSRTTQQGIRALNSGHPPLGRKSRSDHVECTEWPLAERALRTAPPASRE